MYGYDCEYEQYYEPSEVDILLDEFKEKCRGMILPNVKGEIDELKKDNKKLNDQNVNLITENRQLKNDVKIANETVRNSILIDNILKSVNKKNLSSLLEIMYKKDYSEDTYEVPLWLGLLTEYYSHKNEIIEMFNVFKIDVPKNISDFRLPVDWNEEEMDIFFDTLRNHYVCNGCIYKSNLRYWSQNSLKNVKEQCHTNYSEIPWQFVLMNPLLRKDKYLQLMGKNIFNSSHGSYFLAIDKYQPLKDSEIKMILNNIDFTQLKELKWDLGEFILRNIHLIENDKFADKVYLLLKDKYEAFKYIQKMDKKYVKKYLLSHKDDALDLLKKCDVLTKKEKQDIVNAIIGD